MSNLLADGMDAITESQGKSQGYMLMKMAEAIYRPGHPMRLFHKWMHENEGNVKQAIIALGLEPPPEGPGLAKRIKELVTPVLVKQYREQER